MVAIQRIGIVGAGQMGAGIAQVSAQAGLDVVLLDIDRETAQRSVDRIVGFLSRLVEKGRMQEADRDAAQQRLKASGELGELSRCDFAVEAVTENPTLKLDIFRRMDEAAAEDAILASNTSSISITKIAAVTQRPQQVIGMHFMNPVPLMTLVEVIRGLQTSDPTYARTLALAERLGKETVTAKKDYPGFIVNRILIPLINEACFALMEDIGSAEDIDKAIKLGLNHPMGPLALADFIGLDTCLAIAEVLHCELGDDKYRPCPLLRKHVEAGWLGRKAGRGFYAYPS